MPLLKKISLVLIPLCLCGLYTTFEYYFRHSFKEIGMDPETGETFMSPHNQIIYEKVIPFQIVFLILLCSSIVTACIPNKFLKRTQSSSKTTKST